MSPDSRHVTPWRLLVSAYMWVVCLSFAAVGITATLASLFVCPRRVTYAIFRGTIRLGLRAAGVKVRLKGAEHLDPSRPYIVVCNHVNVLDPFIISTLLPKFLTVLEKPDNFRIPVYGEVMRRWGNIPLTRGNLEQTRQDLVRASAVLHGGESWILVFPEGTRTRTGYFSPFKKGAFHLAVASGVPLLPLTQNGAMRIWTKGKWLLMPGEMEVIVHPPIDPAPYDEARIPELAEHVKATILSAYTGPREHAEAPKALTPSA